MEGRRPLLVFLGILLVLATVRFDRRWSWGGGVEGEVHGDHVKYVQYVEFLRGDASAPPPPPFRQRVLGPLLAAALPLPPLTSLDVLNLAALVLCLTGLDALLLCLGLSPLRRTAGLALFVVSFPVVFYATIGYVDPLVVTLLTLIAWALLTGRHGLAIALATAGFFVKEWILVAWPGIASVRHATASTRRFWAFELPALIVLAVVPGLLTGVAGPEGGGPGSDYWQASWSVFMANASRPRAWISGALGAGLPWLGAAAYAVRRARGWPSPYSRTTERVLALGTVAVLALWVFAFLGVYADGRFPWMAYPFAIPMAVAALVRD